jgi:VWFA-related protein
MLKIACYAAALLLAAARQQPSYTTGVDLVAVEVTVVDRDGVPVTGLSAGDFDVTISGRPHRVVSAEWLSYGSGAGSATASATTSTGAASPPAPRRMFILAVDEESLQPAAAIAARTAGERFIDKLRPDDFVGVYAFPTGTAKTDLAIDHTLAKKALSGLQALRHEPPGAFHMSPSEIVDIASNDGEVLARVAERECAPATCDQRQVRAEAMALTGYLENNVAHSVDSLRGLMRGLARIPGRKVLVLISGGLISTDRNGLAVNTRRTIGSLAADAASANVQLFVLHLDWSFQELLVERSALRPDHYREGNLAATGLEVMAGTLGGDVARVMGTKPDYAFDRVLRESSAYYLLGVEPGDEDRDGKPHPIKVKVKRRGLEVLNRAAVTIPVK